MIRMLAAVLPLLLVVVAAPTVHAGPAVDTLKAGVDRALKVLEDPSLKGESHAADRRKQLRDIADGLFDFEEMSKRTLATHWQKRTPDERQQFSTLFADLLENTYFNQIDTYSGGGSVKYGAETINGDQATVRTVIVTSKGTEIPADYRMHQKNGKWLVYDVSIEGVSLVNNYRAQFNQIIQRGGYAELVQRLQKKSLPAPAKASAS
jgi:phospholipid transport system substrate-binding protein